MMLGSSGSGSSAESGAAEAATVVTIAAASIFLRMAMMDSFMTWGSRLIARSMYNSVWASGLSLWFDTYCKG